jgi:hypothetical protein
LQAPKLLVIGEVVRFADHNRLKEQFSGVATYYSAAIPEPTESVE